MDLFHDAVNQPDVRDEDDVQLPAAATSAMEFADNKKLSKKQQLVDEKYEVFPHFLS